MAIFWSALCFVFLTVPYLYFAFLLFFFLFSISLKPFTSILKLCLLFIFRLPHPFISSHEELLPGLKGSTRKDPSARLVFSWGCIQRVALFCSAHYHIYPTPDSLYCRSQDLFSNLLQSCMKLYALLDTNYHTIHTFISPGYLLYICVRQIFMNTGYVYNTVYHYMPWCIQWWIGGICIYVCFVVEGDRVTEKTYSRFKA